MHDMVTGWQFVLANARLHRLPDPKAAATAALRTVDMMDAKDRDIATCSNGMDPRQRLHLMDLLRLLGEQGRTVLFRSHILEEVEEVAGTIEVLVAGRHAASGDFRRIRRLRTERPHQYTIRSSDDGRLAAAIIADGSADTVDLTSGDLAVQAPDLGVFVHALPRLARDSGIRLLEVSPADESLESVVADLVAR